MENNENLEFPMEVMSTFKVLSYDLGLFEIRITYLWIPPGNGEKYLIVKI